jgi:PAS domain S-box-containing protein
MKSMKSTVERTNEEEVLKILSEQVPVGVCIMQDGKFCYVNSNFPIAIGYAVDELVGKDSLEIVVPEDREMVMENTVKMLKGELLSPYQFRVTCKDGSIIWVMATVKSIEYHGRRATLGNYMEITGRKQMEEALKESEVRYRELANSITNVFFAMDEHLRYTYWNRASEILTGIRAEDAIGKSLREIFPDKPWRRRAEKIYRSVLKAQQPRTFVNDYAIDDRHYIFEINAYPSRGGISVFVKDITESRQAEEKLKESEQKYRLLFETSLDCIVQIDREGRYLAANPATARSLGVPLEELIGKTVFEVMPQESAQFRLRNMRKVLDEWHPQIFEDERAGRYFHHVVIPLKTSDQQEAVQVITRDITELKQAEEALRQSEERYRTILEEMEDAYFEVDLGGHFTFVNNSVCRDLGYSREELIGMSYKVFTVEEDIESVFQIFNEVYRTGVLNKGFPWKTIRKDGVQGFAETSVSPLRNDKGEIIGFRGVGRDVTERKQAEEKLRQSKENYRALFDSSVVGALVVDAETMQVVIGNQAAVKMFGFSSAEEGAGVNPLDFVPPEDREKNLDLIVKEVFEKDSRKAIDLPAVTKDGRKIWVSATGARIMHKGRLACLFSFTDITERKRAEEALRQSEEKYRTILEEMEDAYFEVDLGGHLTFVNNSVCRDLGYSREELIGMSYKDFTVEEDIESVFRVFNEVYRTGAPNKGFPWKTIRKDCVQGFAETSVSPLRNDKGDIIGFRGVGRDITERKQVEEKLRQSEENYKTLFNSSVTGMYVMDAQTFKVVMGNRAAREMVGFGSAEEGIGVNPFDFVVPEDREKVLEIAINEFLQDSRRTHEIRVMDKNGRRGWQSISIARIIHNGRLSSLVSFTDITERKRMEEALRQSEENYRALFDSSVIGTFVLDAETMKVVMGNEAAMKLAGLDSPSEGIGINPFDFVIPEDRERILEIVNKELFEQDLRRIHEFRAVTKDGRKIWISITGARIIHGGKLAGLISFTDITERKQAEEALRQSEENYRVLFNSAVIGMVVLDAETMKVVMANQAALKMFGFSSIDEAIALNPIDLIVSEDRERALESTVKDTLEQDLQRAYEFQAVTKDGREIWISTRGARIVHEGKLAALISFTDITEQKQQREQLIMTDRLASLGELAAGTAHELNNPLTSIIGFSQLLMEKEVPDDISEDLKLINNEAQRAASVTKNLLTFARKHAPVKQLNQINSIIEDVLELRAYEHKVKSIEVKRYLAPDLPQIMVDYFQIQQVFINIVINAEYFMNEAHNNGTLTITTTKQNNNVRISIADDGPGVPPKNLRRIFDPFFTTKEAGKGTGLGLSICHGIVTEHGGQIYVRSQLGRGTTVFIELPINSRDHIKSML